MDIYYIKKQDLFYSYCMNLKLPEGNWVRYRFVNNQLVQHDNSGALMSALYSVGILYQQPYNRRKGRAAFFPLFSNYMQVKELNACMSRIDKIDYLRVLFVIDTIKDTYPNVAVYFPRKQINGWKKYKTFHLQPFSEKLDAFNIMNSFEPTGFLNTNADTLVIFELSSNPKSIDNNINEIVNVYNQQPPNLIYLSLFTEVGKEGEILYYKKEEIGKMFRQ